MKLVTKAIFQSARTTIDGGWRFTFDANETDAEFVTQLAKLKGMELFIVVATPEEIIKDAD